MGGELNLESVIPSGKNKGKKVRNVVNKKKLLVSIREGLEFDDEVLLAARIKKVTHEAKTINIITEHERVAMKKYPQDTASVEKILEEILLLDKYHVPNEGDVGEET